MVTARVFLRPDNAIEMRVNGHANFADLGRDPVCAGASVLAMTVAQCIDLMAKAGSLDDVKIKIGDGNVRVVAKPKEDAIKEAMDFFHVAAIGFQLLQESYPEHVKLILLEPVEEDEESEETDSE